MRDEAAAAIVKQIVENYRDAYHAARMLSEFSRNRFAPELLRLSGSPHNDAIIGLFQRVNFWFASLAKLDSYWDFQTVMNAARAVYELTIDIRILCINQSEDPSLIEKFHVFPSVTRYDAAKKFIDAVDKFDASESYGGVEEKRRIVNDPRIAAGFEAEIKKHWNGRAPSHWTGLDLVARINKYLPPENIVDYRDMYAQFSWHVHSGSAGLDGMSEVAIIFMYFQGHAHLCEYFYHAAYFTGLSAGLFHIRPEFKAELDEVCDCARAMTDQHTSA